MEIITDELLHLYYLNSGLIDKDKRELIEKRLLDNGEIKSRLEKIKYFYEEYEKLRASGQSLPDNAEKTGKITVLFPLEFESSHNSTRIKLAADSELDETDNFKYIKTFACAKTFILMRLHYNPVKKLYKLFLISEKKEDISNVKVRIPEANLEFKSDSDGIVDLQNNNITDVSFVLIEK